MNRNGKILLKAITQSNKKNPKKTLKNWRENKNLHTFQIYKSKKFGLHLEWLDPFLKYNSEMFLMAHKQTIRINILQEKNHVKIGRKV